jgi:hypothetical protein
MRLALALMARLWPKKAVPLPPSPAERLVATLKPRPDLRDRRFATWSMDRRERYLAASYGTPHSILRRADRLTAASSDLPVSALPPVIADTGLSITSGAGSSAAKMSETGLNSPERLDRTCGASSAVKQARISTPMNQPETI